MLICQHFWVVNAQVQNPTAYETITTAQGLSQGMVFDILQDKEGFIWVATKNGLNRYDGYSFKVFTNDPYNANTLSSNTIVKLFEDSRGRIWAGTEDAGLNIYDKVSGKFHRVVNRVSDPSSLSGNNIRLIEEMTDGRVLVAIDGAGFNIVSLPVDFFEKNSAPVITRLTLPNNEQVYGMGKDRNGIMWIGGMDRAVYRFDALKNSFTPLKNAALCNSGYFTTDGSIIIGSNLFLYDGTMAYPLFDTATSPAGNIMFRPNKDLWDKFHREIHFYDVSRWENGKAPEWNMQLPEKTRLVYPFIIDRSGLLWSGSVGYGLRKYNTGGNKFKTHVLPGNSIRWIIPISPDDILTGDYAYGWTRVKGGLIEKDPFKKTTGLPEIDNLMITKAGDFWLKCDKNGYFKYTPATRKLVPFPGINFYDGVGSKQPMFEDSKGILWFSGLGGRITTLDPVSGKLDSFSINNNAAKPMMPKSVCTALYEDKAGTCWIGTQEGFARIVYSGSPPNITRLNWYYNNSASRNSLNYNHVSCFIDDPASPDKYIWIGTKGGGLNRFDKINGNFFHLTTKNGLPDDVVYGMLPDDAGNIWGSTNKGIFCLLTNKSGDSTQWIFRNFSKSYGLQDDEFNTGAYAKLQNGLLAFGGVNGMNIFDPRDILSKGFTPNTYLTDILINNSPVSAGDKTGVLRENIEHAGSIVLNHLQDILTLEFSSLDFTAPLQNKYRYMLEGIDKTWVESGNRRTATYLHLPPGKYTFKVQGSNSQGIWSDKIDKLQITVLPPWWRTWWSYALYLLMAVLAIMAFFRFRINKARLQSQLNFEQLEAKRVRELDTIKTELYTNITHEFRTPLTVILGMAQQVISKPAEHFQNGMDMIVRNGQSLLNLVNQMLDLSKLETGKMQLQLVNADIINFLRYIVESFHSLAESQLKQLHFLSEIDSLFMAYDPEKIRQIISNLLSNALKFTPERGNIYISVQRVSGPGGDQDNFIIKVKDTGIGIPEDQQQHIFDRFHQLDNSHTRKAGGTGIGLALTRELVRLMGGEIFVKSPPSGTAKGTEFTVSIPLKKEPEVKTGEVYDSNEYGMHLQSNPAAAFDFIDEKHNREAPLILLVEDNADVVAYTASCLPDYRLAVGKDGREGFDIASEIIPDLVITDVMMPFVDGFELCRKLRSNEHTSHIPIIMLTAKTGIDSKLEGLRQGADVYLEKPFNREELLVRIEKILELRKNLQQYYLKKAGVSNNKVPVEAVGEEVLHEIKTEHEFVKKVREIVEAHISDTGFTVEQLCKQVFMSHSQLHRKLDALTGCSPNKFIRMIRLGRAMKLLTDPANSIGAVSLDCGYADPGYFARVFKQEYGVTPQEWRAGKKNA